MFLLLCVVWYWLGCGWFAGWVFVIAEGLLHSISPVGIYSDGLFCKYIAVWSECKSSRLISTWISVCSRKSWHRGSLSWITKLYLIIGVFWWMTQSIGLWVLFTWGLCICIFCSVFHRYGLCVHVTWCSGIAIICWEFYWGCFYVLVIRCVCITVVC